MARSASGRRFRASALDDRARFFAWVAVAAAVLAIALAVVREGPEYDATLGVAINALFARLPLVSLVRVLFDEGLAELTLVVGIVAVWQVPRLGALDRNALRERTLLTIGAFVPTYAVTRTMQHFGHTPRPINVLPLAPLGPPDLYRMMKVVYASGGSFPSDHAALSAIAAVVAFSLAVRVGWFFWGFGIVASLDRIAVGYHWTSDVLGGALVGVVVAGLALAAEPRLSPMLAGARRLFETRPVTSYVVAVLFLGQFGEGFGRLEAGLRDLGVGKLFH